MGRCVGVLRVALVLAASGPMVVNAKTDRRTHVSTTVNQLEVQWAVTTPEIPSADRLVVVVVLKNKSAENMRLNALFLDMPKVLLKVRDRNGLPVYPGPPGMPPLDDGETGRKVLGPE